MLKKHTYQQCPCSYYYVTLHENKWKLYNCCLLRV